MATVIVLTDLFNIGPQCIKKLAFVQTIELLLVNIDAVPASYSGDGVSMAAISDTIGNTVDKLQAQVETVQETFPAKRIQYKALIGAYIKTLKALIEEEEAVLIILGTPAAYGEIWSWDTDTLSAMTELPVPVLSVPQDVAYKPMQNISFASIPGNLHSASTIESIKKLIKYTGAKLHVVSVVMPQHDEKREQEAETALREQLTELDTVYHKIEDPHIVQAIGSVCRRSAY